MSAPVAAQSRARGTLASTSSAMVKSGSVIAVCAPSATASKPSCCAPSALIGVAARARGREDQPGVRETLAQPCGGSR
jgi:hypothetical protein